MNFHITKFARSKVEELVDAGWEFDLAFTSICHTGLRWEANFSKRIGNGKWENFSGEDNMNPSDAIEIAYKKVKNL